MDKEFLTEEELEKIKQEVLESILTSKIVEDGNVVRDKLGRAWTLQNWFNRTYRTAVSNDLFDNTINLLNEYEHDEVSSSSISDSSDLCSPYQNRCFSISGKTFPLLENALFRGGGGLLHPNCRHFIDPYFRGISELEEELPNKEVSKLYENRKEYLKTYNQYKKWEVRLNNAEVCKLDLKKYQDKVDYWSGRLSKLDEPISGEYLRNFDN